MVSANALKTFSWQSCCQVDAQINIGGCHASDDQALRGRRVGRDRDRIRTDRRGNFGRHHHGGAGARHEAQLDVRPGEERAEVSPHSTSPLLTSHFWITSAISALFLSCISMCELPLMPMSGRLTRSTLPPAALIALPYSVSRATRTC